MICFLRLRQRKTTGESVIHPWFVSEAIGILVNNWDTLFATYYLTHLDLACFVSTKTKQFKLDPITHPKEFLCLV